MKTVTITLTTGAAHLLGQLAAVPGLMTDAATLYRVGQFAESHLSDLPVAPKDAAPADIDAWANCIREPLEVSTGVHAALKTAVKTAIEKGMLPGGKPTLCLIRELDLAPKED